MIEGPIKQREAVNTFAVRLSALNFIAHEYFKLFILDQFQTLSRYITKLLLLYIKILN